MCRTSRGTDKPEPPVRPILARLAYENEEFGNIVPLPVLVGPVVFILALGLLIAIQVRFLWYQSEFITRCQQIVVSLDVVMEGVFLVYTGFLRNRISELKRGSPFEQVVRPEMNVAHKPFDDTVALPDPEPGPIVCYDYLWTHGATIGCDQGLDGKQGSYGRGA